MKKISPLFFAALALSAMPFIVSAHVGYVLDHSEFVSHEGADSAFLVSGVQQDPTAVLIAVLVGLLLIGAIIIFRKNAAGKRFMVRVTQKLASYEELLPWMARLSLGIALLGAGTASAFISPVLATASPAIAFLEIILGFLFLLGFLTVPAVIATVILFISGLAKSSYLIGNFDLFALAISVFLLGSTRPGLDDILGIGSKAQWEGLKRYTPLVLRLGLGVAFIFLAVYEKFLNPHDSELVVQTYHLMNVIPVPAALWVFGAGAVELLLGALLIIGFEIRVVSVIAFLVISLSFFYFKESVYSHVTLFGALSMLLVLGAGAFSVDRLFKRKNV